MVSEVLWPFSALVITVWTSYTDEVGIQLIIRQELVKKSLNFESMLNVMWANDIQDTCLYMDYSKIAIKHNIIRPLPA